MRYVFRACWESLLMGDIEKGWGSLADKEADGKCSRSQVDAALSSDFDSGFWISASSAGAQVRGAEAALNKTAAKWSAASWTRSSGDGERKHNQWLALKLERRRSLACLPHGAILSLLCGYSRSQELTYSKSTVRDPQSTTFSEIVTVAS